MRVRASLLFLFCFLPLGCGAPGKDSADAAVAGDQDTTSPPMWTVEGGDGVRALVQRDPFAIKVFKGDAEIMAFGPKDIGFGEVEAIDESYNYDPYYLHHVLGPLKADPPEGLRWNGVVGVLNEVDDGAPETLTLDVALALGGNAQIRLRPSIAGVIELTLSPAPDRPTAYIYTQWPAQKDENFYGLGESFDHVARRGTYRAMQFEPLLGTESAYNEAHVPVPLLISTRGPAWFFESRLPMYFDVGFEDPDIVRMEVGWASELKIHLIGEEVPSKTIGRYHGITGRPLVPPFWAFAPQYWRNETSGQDEVLADLAKIRAHDIPAGVFWIDRPWQQTYNDFIFDPEKYDDPQTMIDQMNALGFELILWSAPYTSEESDAWAECSEENYFYEGPKLFTKFGLMMDLTNPDAVSLWMDLVSRVVDMGARGFKLDYAEDIQVGVLDERLHFLFHDGSDERTMHHLYSYYYQKAYFDSLPAHPGLSDGSNPHGVDGFVLGRTGTYGGQTVAHAIWPGDLDSDFRSHLEEGVWVGGLPASIVGGLTLGASGYPFYGSDTGGFRSGRPTSEVLIRWAWQTALSPIMQVGGGGTNHFAWEPGSPDEPQYDENTLRNFRAAAKFAMQLASYRFTWGLHAWKTGVPVMRPFGLMYPDDGRHPDDTYLLGPDLLVAPIVSEESTRTIPIPKGRWIDFWTGEVDVGPDDVERDVPLDRIALWLREGAIVPLLREDADTLTTSTDPEVVSVIQDPGTLTWVVAPGLENLYINHDGSTLSHEPGWQLRVSVSAGELFKSFALDLRFGLDREIPTHVNWRGATVPAVESMEAYGACTEPCLFKLESQGRLLLFLGETPPQPTEVELY